MGHLLQTHLADRFGQHPHIGDIRGRGRFPYLELVADWQTKKSFVPNGLIASRIKQAAYDARLICYPIQGTNDGQRGDHLLITRSFLLNDAHMDELVDKLDGVIATVLS